MFEDAYEFDGYILNPRNRLLLFGDRRIELAGLDFDLLVFMVERPGQLLLKSYLLDGVWGSGRNVEEGNLSGHISTIRKALGCNPLRPKFIETVSGKGYRFIGNVKSVPCERTNVPSYGEACPTETTVHSGVTRHRISVESHKFVPVYLGNRSLDFLSGTDIVNEWGNYRSIQTDLGRICVFPFGVGVWHLIDSMEFDSLTHLAQWRRSTYEKIKLGEHAITGITKRLLRSVEANGNDLFPHRAGEIGYVLSLLVLSQPCWPTSEEIVNGLKVLSCPTPLSFLDSRTLSKAEYIQLEGELLRRGVATPDMKEFGMPGVDVGFASWPGVSYYCALPNISSVLLPSIVDFEVALQATWWYSWLMHQELLAPARTESKGIEIPLQHLVKQLGRLKSIDATESISKRTMREAILETSRIENLVQDTLDLFHKS